MTDNDFTKDEIKAMLTAAAEEMRKRAAESWEPSDTGPPVLIVDEMHDLAPDDGVRRPLEQMIRESRVTG